MNKQPLLPARASEESRDKANLLKTEMEAEYVEHKRAKANPTKKMGKKILKAEYKRGQMQPQADVMERHDYRRHILSLSLFPNLFNRAMVMTHEDADY